MNIQQTVTDIQVMMTYIKERINLQAPLMNEKTLDGIGANVLAIKESLHDLTENGFKEKEQSAWNAQMADSLEQLHGSLQEMKQQMDQTNTERETIMEAIKDNYAACALTEKEIVELQRKQIQTEQSASKVLTEEIPVVEERLEALSAQLRETDSLSSQLEALEAHLKEVRKTDQTLNQTYLENAGRLDNLVKNIQASYHELNETLVSVDSSFRTAVSRLDVLLMQIKLLTGEK